VGIPKLASEFSANRREGSMKGRSELANERRGVARVVQALGYRWCIYGERTPFITCTVVDGN